MRLSEAWLREFVDPPVNTAALVSQLTMAGIEVDTVEPAAEAFTGVVVAEVVEVAPHPQADRLRVCQVDDGSGRPLQVVCGAPNVAVGLRVPLAVEGAVLPGGLQIRRSELRGVPSMGMLCSAKELGLEDSEAGLLRLPQDAPLGADVRTVLKLDDAVLEIDLTPNRADCLSVEGIAREAALLNRIDRPLVPMVLPLITCRDEFPVTVSASEACPRYLGRVIRNIHSGVRTPLWMRERLRRSGLRSLDPVVDVTNYVLLELGQPLHAFDLDKLIGGVEVRYAREGERLTLLNDETIAPDASTLVIADQRQILALAGVMGGKASAVSGDTRDLFLECAFFSPEVIMGRARRYGLVTDSSHRFERGVDPELQRRALERATQMILDLVGGQAGPVTDVTHAVHLPKVAPIVLRKARIERILGVDMPNDQVLDILRRLDMQVVPVPQGWRVTPPSFRFDLALEVDLIEELGRVLGYDALPKRRPTMSTAMRAASESQLDPDRLRDLLVDRGYQEAITYSFVEPGLQHSIEPAIPALALRNPISSDMAVMRTTLWCGLIDAALKNQSRQQSRIRLFELGATFAGTAAELEQTPCLGGLVMGTVVAEQWGSPAVPVDFFDVKADLEALLGLGGRQHAVAFRAAEHPALHPGQSAQVLLEDQQIGWLGMLHPRLEKSLAFDQRVFLFHLELAPLLQRVVARFRPLSKFPRVRRDLALVVDQAVSAKQVADGVRAIDSQLVREIVLFDVYQGKGVDPGKKSVAVGLILQDDDETLTDARIDSLMTRVVEHLQNELKATLRA